MNPSAAQISAKGQVGFRSFRLGRNAIMSLMSDQALERTADDEDRSRVIETLRASAARLGMEELERRLDAAVHAATVGDLALLVWDLQGTAPPPPPRKISVWQNTAFRLHAAAYGMTNALLIGTWGLTGHGFFWPFFPIAGWGIGLAGHGIATESSMRHRQERESRKALYRTQKALDRAARRDGAAPAVDGAAPVKAVGPSSRPSADGRSAASGVRSSVVVMFADIVDSTRLTAVIGDEDWTRVRGRCRELLQACYSAHAGAEVSTHGDGFLARFTSAGGAVRCAIEIQRRLQDERRQIGFAPTLRIGANCGEAMDEDGDLLGAVVNLAARVMADAQPGEIMITEAIADRLDDRFVVEDRGLRLLKGMSRPTHLLSVTWVE